MAKTIPEFVEVCPFDGSPYRTHTFRNAAITDPPAPPEPDQPRQPVEDIARTVYECGTVLRLNIDPTTEQQTEYREQSDTCDRNEKPFLRAEIKRLKDEKAKP